jgi:hypothetical protein
MAQNSKSNRVKSVQILFRAGWIGVSPTILNAIQLLVQEGYEVDILIARHPVGLAACPPLPKGASVKESWRLVNRLRKTWTSKNSQGTERGTPSTLQPSGVLGKYRSQLGSLLGTVSYTLFVLVESIKTSHQVTIAVDIQGAFAAALPRLFLRSCDIFWSLELADRDGLRDVGDILVDWVGQRQIRRSHAIVVQDATRAEVLKKQYSLPNSRVVLVPNSPAGLPHRIASAGRSSFLHERCGIGRQKKIVLHAGMISPITLSLELARAASSWPEDLVLVFHERSQRVPSDPYLQAVLAEGGNRTYLSLDPVPLDEVDDVYSSAHIGVLCYDPNAGATYAHALGSSGKLAYYLRNSVPVVYFDPSGAYQGVSAGHCGIGVGSLADIGDALSRICSDYSNYSAGANTRYRNDFEFGRHFRQLIDIIEAYPRARF